MLPLPVKGNNKSPCLAHIDIQLGVIFNLWHEPRFIGLIRRISPFNHLRKLSTFSYPNPNPYVLTIFVYCLRCNPRITSSVEIKLYRSVSLIYLCHSKKKKKYWTYYPQLYTRNTMNNATTAKLRSQFTKRNQLEPP